MIRTRSSNPLRVKSIVNLRRNGEDPNIPVPTRFICRSFSKLNSDHNDDESKESGVWSCLEHDHFE